MQGNQNPRNVPPAMPVEWQQGSIGFKHGLQSSEVWVAGEQDSRQIRDQRLAKNLWRVSVIGSEFIRLNVVYGTSRAVELKNIQTPFAFFAPGQLAIYAFPVRDADVGFCGRVRLLHLHPRELRRPLQRPNDRGRRRRFPAQCRAFRGPRCLDGAARRRRSFYLRSL